MSDLPQQIQIVKNNGDNISPASVSWDNNPNVLVDPNDFTIGTITDSLGDNFGNDGEEDIEVRMMIVGNDKPVKLKFKLRTIYEIDDGELMHDKNHDKNFAGYDENKISVYPGSETGEPWLYLRTYGLSFLYFKPNHRGKKESVLDALNFKVSPNTGNYSPDHDKDFYLRMHSYTGNPEQIIDINLCNDIDLAQANVYPNKTLTVELYTVCESDDDKVNYCVDANGKYNGYLKANCIDSIDSPDFVCIDPGDDGSLDLYFPSLENNFWKESDIDLNKATDSLMYTDINFLHTLNILAGDDLYCNTIPMQQEIECPELLTEEEIQKIEDNLNTIYNQGGISNIVVNYNGYKNLNFDVSKEDNKLDPSIEAIFTHLQEYGGSLINLNSPFPNNENQVLIYLVNEIDGARGLANQYYKDLAFINLKNQRNSTISHEIGHALYGLVHPDGADYEENGLQDTTTQDFYNVMNSGKLFNSDNKLNKTTKKIEEFKVRKYQWTKIHEN